MAAGCVPVLYDGGGLAEIVSNGRDGFLWQTLEVLKSQTRSLIGDQGLRTRLAAAAQGRSRDFSRARFEKRWLEVLEPVLSN
jgi:glycosyltransferase involved in cell wall biosynthesis